jgi:uncharacterized protein (TIGR03085 family)
MMGYARDERLALCAVLDDAGPREPTLCEGWSTLDLAAHLVVRERRPDAAVGIIGGPLARYTARVQRRLAARTPYPRLVQAIREGPPRLSPLRIADEQVNLVEFFVHSEDVRRARPGWEPRAISQDLADTLWRRLRTARFVLRKVPVGIEFARDDQPEPEPDRTGRPATPRVRMTARARTPTVTVTGAPSELTLWALGRTGAARVRLDGSEDAIQALSTATWGA